MEITSETYKFAFGLSVLILAGWMFVLLLSEIAQRAWAWIDDSERCKKNFIHERISFSKWKYPVYCEHDLKSKNIASLDIHGYAKDKALDGASIFEPKRLTHEVDFIYSWQSSFGSPVWTIGLTSLSPMVILFSIHIYPVVLFAASSAVMGYVARFARRHKKLFDKHLTNKEAHK